jgi:hypothetical protein
MLIKMSKDGQIANGFSKHAAFIGFYRATTASLQTVRRLPFVHCRTFGLMRVHDRAARHH